MARSRSPRFGRRPERDAWSLALLTREAARNVFSPTARMFPLLLIAVLLGSLTVAVAAHSSRAFAQQLDDLADQGRGLVVFGFQGDRKGAIDRGSCEALHGQTGIRSAGVVESLGTIDLLQLGSLVPLKGVSSTQYPELGTVDAVVGQAMADEAGLFGEGRALTIQTPGGATALALVDGRRPAGMDANYALATLLPPHVTEVGVCAVQFERFVDPAAAMPLVAAQLGVTGDPVAGQLALQDTIDPIAAHLARPERFLPILLGLIGALAVAVLMRFRSSELAVYRLSGTSPRSLGILLTFEQFLLTGAWAASATLTTIALAGFGANPDIWLLNALTGALTWAAAAAIAVAPTLCRRPTDMAKDR